MLTTGLEVEKLVYGGDGLSRKEGRVILTPFVLAGERVEAEVEETKQGVARGKLIGVSEPSAQRVEPGCPYFGRCGGCHYQHASYEAQLEAKRGILIETLQRVGKLSGIPPVQTVAAEPWGYRNRVQFHIENGKLGYRERGSRKLCAIEKCPISSPKINECITALNGMLRDRRWPKFIRSLEVFTNEWEVQINVLEYDQPVAKRFFDWCAEMIPGVVTGALDYGQYRVSHGSFFQVNRFLAEGMVQAVLEGQTGGSALDLYAGVGLFSVPLTENFGSVTAVESGTGAVRDLAFNAERANVEVFTCAGNVDDYLSQLEHTPDFVLADPPRAGLGKTVCSRLNEMGAARMAIVSCDPATLARDLAALPNYQLESLTLIDLFPQTFHIETIAKLALKQF